MLNRLLRVICGILFVLTLPLGAVVFLVSFILTGNPLINDIMEWILINEDEY